MWRKQHSVSLFRMVLLSFTLVGGQAIYAADITIREVSIEIDYPRGHSKRPEYSGSSLFKECQSMLPSEIKWKDVITTKSSVEKDKIWENAWNKFGHEQQNKLDDLEGEDFSELIDFYEDFNEDLARLQRNIAECEAMRSLTKGTDFTDSDATVSGKSSAKQSVDGKIKCVSAGPETQDYKACLKALDIYNGALVGTAVFTQVQEVKYQGDSVEAISGMNPNDPTAGLKAQKNDIESRANITGQRAGLDVAKAAGLWATMESIPDHKTLKSRCNADATQGRKISYDHIQEKLSELIGKFYHVDMSIFGVDGEVDLSFPDGNRGSPNGNGQLNHLAQQIQDIKDSSKLLTDYKITKFCNQAINNAPELLVNQKARQGLRNAMIAAGIDGVKHKLTADQLNKQADQVGRIINEVDNFNPEELPQFQGQDFQGSECALDPSAEGCDDFVNERSFGFQDRGPLQIHGMENASNFSRGDDPRSRGGDDDSGGASNGPSGAPKPIGIIDPKVAKKSGFDGRMPGAADVSSDGPAAGGGGGGGGAPGGGGSPPPSQVPQQKQGNDGPRMSDSGNSRAGYSGGGGSLRRSGGRGAMGRGSSDDGDEGNPFAELFGDKDPTKSETLNFRDTASAENQINTPDTSIFEIISDRYANVQQEDRLLEYEVQDPDKLQ